MSGQLALIDQLKTDMKVAMKARDKDRLDAIRMLLSALKNLLIEKKGQALTPDEEINFLSTEAKKRRESIEAYTAGGRDEMAENERKELAVIEGYLPAPFSPEEVKAMIAEVIAATGASAPSDMGKVMGQIMPKVKGRFPGKDVGPLVKAALS